MNYSQSSAPGGGLESRGNLGSQSVGTATRPYRPLSERLVSSNWRSSVELEDLAV